MDRRRKTIVAGGMTAVCAAALLMTGSHHSSPASAVRAAMPVAVPVSMTGTADEAPRRDTVPAWLIGYWSGIAYDHFDSATQCPFQVTILRSSGGPRITYYRTEDYYCYRLELLSANDSSAVFNEVPFGYSYGKLRRIKGTYLYIQRGADSGKAGGYYYSGHLDQTRAHFEMTLISPDQGIQDQCKDQW